MSDSSPSDAGGIDGAAAADPEKHFLVRPAIFLDYGADSAAGEDAACEVCCRGMRFRSRWKFEIGTVLNVAFSFHEGVAARIEAEGVVAECKPDGEQRHVTTLAFVEVPKELHAALAKISAHLVFPEIRGASSA